MGLKSLFAVGPDAIGKGKVLISWNTRGTHLAVAGSKRKVTIFDRSGKQIDEIGLVSEVGGAADKEACSCVSIAWDSDGENLAIMPTLSNVILLWSVGERKTTKLDTGMKDLSYMSWCRTSPTLAVGTAKGNLLIFNEKVGKKIPIMGKHTRKIICGAWTPDNKLVLGAEDKSISVSRQNGDTICAVSLRGEPSDVSFTQRKEVAIDGQRRLETTLSVNMGRRLLSLFRAGTLEAETIEDSNAMELGFQDKYGAIVSHTWFGDGYLLIGFGAGFLVIMSTHNKEVSEEIFSSKVLADKLGDVALSTALQKVAVCGGSTIKVMDLRNYKCAENPGEEEVFTLPLGVTLDRMDWTADGQVLTVCSTGGNVVSYLAALPTLSAVYEESLAYLTSLQEVSVIDVAAGGMAVPVDVEMEPGFIALGAGHVAAGMNNHSFIYRLGGAGGAALRVNEKQYLGTVDRMALNERVAVALGEGRIQVHVLEAASDPNERFDLTIPDKGTFDVTCMGLTPQFLVYGTARGSVIFYYLGSLTSYKAALRDRGQISEYRHSHAVRTVYPNRRGTRVVFADEQGLVWFLNPVTDSAAPVPGFQGKLDACVFDQGDPNVFVLAEPLLLHTYVYHAVSIAGPHLTLVATTERPQGSVPATLHRGTLTLLRAAGSLHTLLLQSHSALQEATGGAGPELQRQRFSQAMALGHLEEAFNAARVLASSPAWTELATRALELLDLQLACRVYRLSREPSMVLSLERLAAEEDCSLLAGHVLVLLSRDVQAAQAHFLRSPRPRAALELRCDLRHWAEALQLAAKVDPSRTPALCRDYAAQLELRGDHHAALDHYQQGLRRADGSTDPACYAGIARTKLHTGDFRTGREMALAANSAQLLRECATVLEGMGESAKAAELYERAGAYDKAAAMYIAAKNLQQAAGLMARVTSPKLHAAFAKAAEAEGRIEQAVGAYEAAGEAEAVVRLYLEPLRNPHKAAAVARKARSVDAAALMAKHFKAAGEYKGAVEFLLLARRGQEAFELAQAHGEMDMYCGVLGDASAADEYTRLAKYYESKAEHAKAGGLYEKCGMLAKALQLYMRAGVSAMGPAIALVGTARDDKLTASLVDFLIGSSDGIPKDHNYLFKLQMATGNYSGAAKTAAMIAKQEQGLGNYKVAHSALVEALRELASAGGRAPAELTRQLLLLHSYVLVKTRVKLLDHLGAAWLLVRVARNISKFPEHVVPILTSTVIECQRADLRRTAYEYATMLMRPEYRSQIADAYKRKIENIVRKPDFPEGDDQESITPCLFCGAEGSCYDLECHSCKTVVPYCLASGKRMVLTEWSQCPSCRFPALMSELRRVLEADGSCPMCNGEVEPSAVVRIEDPLRAHKKTMDMDGEA